MLLNRLFVWLLTLTVGSRCISNAWLVASVTVCAFVCLCPRSERKTAWAINTKPAGTHPAVAQRELILRSKGQTVKGQGQMHSVVEGVHVDRTAQVSGCVFVCVSVGRTDCETSPIDSTWTRMLCSTTSSMQELTPVRVFTSLPLSCLLQPLFHCRVYTETAVFALLLSVQPSAQY